MSMIGLRVGAFEIVGSTYVPEPGNWHLARRTGNTRRQPQEALVRLLPPDADADTREALHKQFEVMRALEDARVPEALAFYEGLGALSIAAVHGASLEDIVVGRQGDVIAMSPTTLVDILIELADTLQRAHHRNRHHGDMSPDRVLLAADGRLWIFGFGEPLGATPNPRWLCPEYRRNEPMSAATDQWHLGALGAGLISGKCPFADDGTDQLDAMIQPVEEQWPALGRLLRQLTDSQPGNRFTSMHPVRQELLALARKAGGTSGRRELGADLSRPRVISVDSGDDAVYPTPTPSSAPHVDLPEPQAEAPDPKIKVAEPTAPQPPPDGFSPSAPTPPDLPPELPTPDVEIDLTISEEFEVPGKQPFPDESFVVVRPDVGTDVPLASVSDTSDVQGLGAPLPTPTMSPQMPQNPLDQTLQAGVVFEPTDPDAHQSSDEPSGFSDPGDGTDAIGKALRSAIDDEDVDAAMQLAIHADSAEAVAPGEGLSWNDLAREFATDIGHGGADTAVPPSIPSSSGQGAGGIDPSAERGDDDDDVSEETEHTNPRTLSGPGSEDSLGIGQVDEQAPEGIAAPPKPSAVATPALIGKVAPIAAGLFVLVWVAWFLSRLLG